MAAKWLSDEALQIAEKRREVKNIFHGNILLSSRLWKNASSEAMLLLLSRFSRATPSTATHQAPPSLGFSRQEHWSGLPFPSPMHESEK